MNNEHQVGGITLAMQRGPYQNNGATPWYSTLLVGTPGQPLKLSLDTGTNITWVTSSLCAADRCQHYSAGRFDYQASSSFTFTDCLQRPYSFGPWGTMQVESGTDVLHINQTTLPPSCYWRQTTAVHSFANWIGTAALACPAAAPMSTAGAHSCSRH